MKDFILNLYASPNFPLYLGIVIGVLVIAFIVIFFIGKKDKKKIEMTQRIDQIVPDAFKEVSTEVKVEVPAQQEVAQVAPVVESIPVMEPEIPVTPIVDSSVAEIPVVPAEPIVSVPVVEDIPVVENPIPAPNTDVSEASLKDYNELLNSIEQELSKLEEQRTVVPTPMPNVVPAEPIVPQTPVNIVDSKPILPSEVLETVAPVAAPTVTETPVVPVAPVMENSNNNLGMVGIELPKLKEKVIPPVTNNQIEPLLSESTEETLNV